VRSAARQIQSYIEGARSRASDAKAPRGVRFILDPTDPRVVASMVYIAPTDPWSEGTVFLTRFDGNNDYVPDTSGPPPYDDSASDVWMLVGFDGALNSAPYSNQNPAQATNWMELYQRGVLRDGNRIQIPAGTGAWYTVDVQYLRQMDNSNTPPSATNRVRLLLQQKYRTPAETPPTSYAAFSGNKPVRYLLELTPGPLANQEPVLFPKNVVVHLDRCSNDPDGLLDSAGRAPGDPGYTTPTRNPSLRGNRLPSTWKISHSPTSPPVSTPADPAGFDYTPYCDLLFSPRGSVTGPEASAGLIHLYVGEMKDAIRDRDHWKVIAPAAGLNWSLPEYQEGISASMNPTDNPAQRADKLVVSIFTRTGAVTSNPLFVNGNGSENVAQRFRYSETGEVAGK